jgi:hypothetical protein
MIAVAATRCVWYQGTSRPIPACCRRRRVEGAVEIELKTRVYALELLTTQLISEYLRSVADPAQQARWARQHLHHAADALPIFTDNLDEEAQLRSGVKAEVSRILEAALARAQTTPLLPRSWDIGPQAG